MDPVGATLGIVSLMTAASGIFTSTVQCFEYIQFGRNFGKDFNKSQVKLDILKLRLTRWGISVGILPGEVQMHEVATSAADVRQAERLLSVILDDIQDVRRKSKRYHDWESSEQGNTQALVLFEKKDLNDKYAAVAERVEDIFAKRMKTIGAIQKTK
jgi:hypothetical protein